MWCHRTELSSWKLSSSSTLPTGIAYECKGGLVRVRLIIQYLLNNFFGTQFWGVRLILRCDLYSGKYSTHGYWKYVNRAVNTGKPRHEYGAV